MATDYEKFTKAPGRDELIKQVRRKIDALGIHYLYLQFISVTGRIMGKGIPADHWENVANGGFQLVYGATVNLFLNRHGEYIGYGPEAAELVGMPEPETFMQLPWDKRVARMFCTLFRNREERDNPGAFLTADCRGNLRRHPRPVRGRSRPAAAARHRARDDVAEEGRRRQSDGGYSQPYCYHIDQFESLRPVYMRVIDYCRQMGLDMIQGDHEDAPASSSSISTMTTRCAPPIGSPPIARSAPRWRASSTSSPASCASRSWACRPMAATTTSRCGRAARTSSSRSATMRRTCPGSRQNYMYRRGGKNTFMPDTGDVQMPGQDRACMRSAASSSISAA